MVNKSGTNSEDIQNMNRALVINLLRRIRPCSRAQLADYTGLQKATITNIVSDLMDWGLVHEVGKLVGKKGRRAVEIELDGNYYKVLGIRLARRFYAVALVDLYGNENESCVKEIQPDEPPIQILSRIKKTAGTYLKRQGEKNYRIISVGMAVPGPVLFKEGRIAYNLQEFPGWEKISLDEEMGGAFGAPFFYDHDANIGAMAEWTYGAFSKNKGTMIYIAAGDGIGAGIVINGAVQRGAQGFFGEIGHTTIDFNGEKCGCGNCGCLDQYASGRYIAKRVLKELPNRPESILNKSKKINASSIIAAARKADALALETTLSAARYLGIGLVNVINSYDPDTIIIGDELSEAGPPFLETVRGVINGHVLPEISRHVKVELTSINGDAVLLGAAAVAIDKITANPSRYFPTAKR